MCKNLQCVSSTLNMDSSIISLLVVIKNFKVLHGFRHEEVKQKHYFIYNPSLQCWWSLHWSDNNSNKKEPRLWPVQTKTRSRKMPLRPGHLKGGLTDPDLRRGSQSLRSLLAASPPPPPSMSSWYLSRLRPLTSSIWSSQGTLSAIIRGLALMRQMSTPRLLSRKLLWHVLGTWAACPGRLTIPSLLPMTDDWPMALAVNVTSLQPSWRGLTSTFSCVC